MGEAAAEELLHRRIEFHAATRPRPPTASAAAMPGGFRMERSLFAAADNRVAAAWGGPEGKMFDNGESSGGGFQLSAARFYLRRIVSDAVHYFCCDLAVRFGSIVGLHPVRFKLVDESSFWAKFSLLLFWKLQFF